MMRRDLPLSLPEEILLLALHDEKGTLGLESYYAYAVGGAVLAELLMAGRVRVATHGRKKLIEVIDATPLGRPFLDDCLKRIDRDSKQRTPESWVSRFAETRGLHHRLAEQLCDRGILKEDEDRILLLFTRRIYPEMDPRPEREIVERLRRAIFSEEDVDARTAVLVSLAHHASLLRRVFAKKDLKSREARIARIGNGDASARATREVIESVQAAAVVAAIIPAVVVTTS